MFAEVVLAISVWSSCGHIWEFDIVRQYYDGETCYADFEGVVSNECSQPLNMVLVITGIDKDGNIVFIDETMGISLHGNEKSDAVGTIDRPCTEAKRTIKLELYLKEMGLTT